MTSLTEREKEIALLVWHDLSNREIGEKLGIKENTVENHLGNIFAKLGIHSRIGLVKKLLEIGLVSP